MILPVIETVRIDRECCPRDVVEAVLDLAIEIARDGREGRRLGTLFTIGRADAVLATSLPLILDPLAGHAPAATHISDPNLRGTLKELAQLDGAFVVSDEGAVLGACRFLDASRDGIRLPHGLGSRHVAAAAVSRALRIVTVAVSESSVVRMFYAGELMAEFRPDLARHHYWYRSRS